MQISGIEQKNNSKFCRDYFIPVDKLRTIDPNYVDSHFKDAMIKRGRQAINDGKVCIVINAGGQGYDSEYFTESKVTKEMDWKLETSYIEAILKKIKSISEVCERELTPHFEENSGKILNL